MKSFCLVVTVALAGMTSLADFAEEAEGAFEARRFVGAGGSLTLPQGGSSLRRVGGVGVNGGYYLTETFALEGGIAWLEDQVGLGVDALVHWRAWHEYDLLFGCERLDPFFLLGARGWLGGGEGQVGPSLGAGALYYLTDYWALRGDALATLGLDGDEEMVYSLNLGLQYSF